MRTSLNVQISVIRALLLREVKTRFGSYNLGYAWALLEPLSYILVLVAIFSMIRTRTGFGGIDFALFFAAGIIPYQLFSKIATSGASAIEANKGLFNYRQVRPLDAFLSRTILESTILLAAFIVLMLIFAWWGFEVRIHDPLTMLIILFLLIVLGLGLSLLLGTASLYTRDASKIASMLFQPLFFLSGIMYPISIIPQPYQDWLLFNPLAHAIELVRESWFDHVFSPQASLNYLAMWALSLLTVGMIAYRSHWQRMVAA